MRYLILFVVCVGALACSPRSIPFGTENGPFRASFDHYAINVTDLPASSAFYQRVFQLDTIFNGTGNNRRVWFSLGEGMALHIIETDEVDVVTPKGVHLCIAMADFDGFVEHLREENIAFETWTGEAMQTNERPDGVRQVYIQDPDGYWVEINDNRLAWQKTRSSK
ncbi:catechol 2,3-dioxygenase-like lactoylglutathione lyase family enzyme [Neolewinella xylanilytica]|uniref:Catechol 2,3-dioxygenase-like lactoylglutathione lyase family enzyme n=1 Tax=Neolewinella xylanilytica TaxID=1514080 RepID=A0A2S6I672_9BACT|nr:VOC family protein [Neolewinella xylanilytica]PPK86645.1 catechol 2,3-dioxygenase-like lactoylglutathione lyase family enzyme [Neolewinella xylanilytica]